MAREEQQPMSDARLVTVRQRKREAAYDAKYENDQWALVYYADVGELLDDNERLRAREAALVEIVERVANGRLMCSCGMIFFPNGQTVPFTPVYMSNGTQAIRHHEDCPIEQARALLAVSEPPATSKPTHLVSVSDLASMDLRHCNVEATCACGNPVAGMFIQDTYDREEVSEFFASAYRVHQSWCPSARALSLKVHELPERSTKLASDSADEAK